jgi:voltage-gated potassium channel
MSFYKELFIALSLFLLVFLIGVFGFYWVAPKANWLDALYMTVITISTVGFGEVVQLGARGKLFTVGFIIVSISVIAYSAKILLSYFIEGTLTQQFQRQRMMKCHRLHTTQFNDSDQSIGPSENCTRSYSYCFTNTRSS